MKNRFHNLAVKRSLNKSLRKGNLTPDQKANVEKALANDENLDLVTAACEEECVSGKWTDFLQWILDHADQIVALIQKLIPLFV